MWRLPGACKVAVSAAASLVLVNGAGAAQAAGSGAGRPEKDQAGILKDFHSVDYLVIGAGSAGCVVSSRLCQALPEQRTLLVEAGRHDDLEQIQSSVDYFGKAESVFGSCRDWAYTAEPAEGLNQRSLYWPRGKVVGGCSSFNTMVFLRGDPSDYDRWAELLDDPSWSYKSLLNCFQAIETHPGDPAVHGKNGPILVEPLPSRARHEVTKAFVAAGQTCLGVPLVKDWALQGNLGAGVNDVNAFAGRRCNAAAFLKRVGAYPNRDRLKIASTNGALQVWLRSRVIKLHFNQDKRVTQVEIRVPRRSAGERTVVEKGSDDDDDDDDADTEVVKIHVKKEVILCGGAVDSPRLLLLSGVGPKQELQALGIPSVAHLPGVGRNLKDHMHVPMCYRLPQGVKPHSHSNICEGTLFAKLPLAGDEAFKSNLQVHCGTLFFEPSGFSPLGEGFTLTPSLVRPRSTGTLRLASSDPDVKPIIEANYLSDPYDLNLLVQGVRAVRQVGEQMLDHLTNKALGRGQEHYPGSQTQDLEQYVRMHASSMYHPACSARMGRDDDPMAVLDSKLQVRGGIKGLRVADASSFPELVGANTNASCIMIGEKCAQMIIAQAACAGK